MMRSQPCKTLRRKVSHRKASAKALIPNQSGSFAEMEEGWYDWDHRREGARNRCSS